MDGKFFFLRLLRRSEAGCKPIRLMGFCLIGFREIGGVFVSGDHVMSASIEGAISSGKSTAEAILAIS